MAVIRLDSLRKNTPKELKTFTYSDIHMDLEKSSVAGPEFVKQPEKSDLRNSVDSAAIQNSIRNLFTTLPGQKLLNPTYGLDFSQFLFSPITTGNAREIGETIFNGITRFEPRIKVININVVPLFDQLQYDITTTYSIPSLGNNVISINGTLSESGISLN